MEPRRKLGPYRERRPIDRDRLHRYLWAQAGATHRLPIDQNKLAELLGVEHSTTRPTVNKMEAEGRLRRVRRMNRILVYQIADPATWKLEDPETHARAHRVMQWG